MKRIGFTGTSQGMTKYQLVALRAWLEQAIEDAGTIEFHHGDCIGADAEAHTIVLNLQKKIVAGIRLQMTTNIVVHPPVKVSGRAHCSGVAECREPKPYLDRNHDIVDETEILIATPRRMHEELRSGTWATVRYARKLKREAYIIWPNGSIQSAETVL